MKQDSQSIYISVPSVQELRLFRNWKAAMATFQDVQAAVHDIAARLNVTPELARAALINPVLALEELGFELDLSGRLELEDRARFSKKQIVERKSLRKKIFAASGHEFDPGQEHDLAVVLFDELKLVDEASKRPDLSPLSLPMRKVRYSTSKVKVARVKASEIARRFPGKAKGKSVAGIDPSLTEPVKIPDPLEALGKAHKIIAPLLAYRQLDASTPRFATEALYRAVRTGKRRLVNITPRAVVTGTA
ncbi:hypothetical protein [Ruegeria sp. HKCCA5463]|uniref:hypothetical protein n=2 Tax=unclassified Ruegeria TaxID=2625375 RepID=UPI001C2BB057|nr:hypothetical protein [Ruegeria sp. HKCCA5463]